MAAPTTPFFNGISAFDQKVLRPLIKSPVQDIISAATLKVDETGKPLLDGDGNQEGFHPYGAMVTATVIAVVVLGSTQFVSNIIVPYSVRSHVILASRIAVGASLFHLYGTAINSIRQQAQGEPSKKLC
jgi:hypothetical protein